MSLVLAKKKKKSIVWSSNFLNVNSFKFICFISGNENFILLKKKFFNHKIFVSRLKLGWLYHRFSVTPNFYSKVAGGYFFYCQVREDQLNSFFNTVYKEIPNIFFPLVCTFNGSIYYENFMGIFQSAFTKGIGLDIKLNLIGLVMKYLFFNFLVYLSLFISMFIITGFGRLLNFKS